MSNNKESGNLKKRTKVSPGYNEASPQKTFKSDGKRTLKEDVYPSDDSQASNNSSQDSASSSQLEESSQSSSQSQSQSSEVAFQKVKKKKNKWTLKLQRGNIFTKLIEVFSEDNPPEKIMYNGTGHNLTDLYDEFWTTFYNSSQHSRGHGSKLPQAQSLTDLELRSMARIIKRGWEDERYWPKKLSPPFLEYCLFQGEHSNQILTPAMFLEFIEPSEKSVIQKLRNADQNVLDIFKKYSCENTVHIGEDIDHSCIKAANKIMIVDMRPIIDIWNQYLSSLMPINTFIFFMMESPNLDLLETIDMKDYSPPHELWLTFFLGWPEDKIRYYIRLLGDEELGEKCNLCEKSPFYASHFISKCNMSTKTMKLERHDAVLFKLETKLCEAIKRGSPYFSTGTDWKKVVMYGNEFYQWPIKDLGVSYDYQLYPHMLVYSLSPSKRILVIEYTISWEYWMEKEENDLSMKYDPVRVGLEEAGFEVEYRVFVLGSRGVLVPKLYNLLKNIFGMKHSEISKTLEEISQEILHIPYKIYKEEELGQNNKL